MASIGRYVLTSDIFEIWREQPAGAGKKIHLVDDINTQTRNVAVEAVKLNGDRFDSDSVSCFFWISS